MTVSGRLLQVLFPLVLGFLLAGCWDVTSPENLMVPTLLAIDWEHSQYLVTVQAVTPALLSVGAGSSGGGGGGGGSSSTPPVWVVQGRGASVLQAVRRADLRFPEPVSLAHLQVLVLGERVLQPKPLTGVVDALFRSPFLVRTFWVFGAVGRAAPIAEAVNPTGLYPAEVLIRSSDRAAADGFIGPQRFSRWVVSLVRTPVSAVLLPIVRLAPAVRPGTGEDFHFPGSYVVWGERLAGRLSPGQMIVWSLVTRQTDIATRPMVQVAAGSTRSTFTIEAHRARIRWTPQEITVDATVTATLDEMGRPGGPMLGVPGASPERLREALAAHLARSVLALIRWSQARNLDLFSIGRIAAVSDPTWFQSHVRDWPRWYRTVPVTVHVTANLESTGNLKNP